jgi:hypothetical protein
MALPKTIERLEDLPDLVRDHYTQKEGVWTLTLLSPDEHAGLVSALERERALKRDADKQVLDLKTKFEGIEPDEVTRLRERVKGLDDAEVYDKHGIDALVAKRTESMKQEHERVVAAKERESAQYKQRGEDFESRWRQDRIKAALMGAVIETNVDKFAVPDAVQRGVSVFTDLDEQGNVISRNPDGSARYGKDGLNPLTPKEWYLTLKTSGEAPHFWGHSSGGGAPAHHSGNGQGVDWSKITSPAERITKFREVSGKQP